MGTTWKESVDTTAERASPTKQATKAMTVRYGTGGADVEQRLLMGYGRTNFITAPSVRKKET